jgi:hypothetical protein
MEKAMIEWAEDLEWVRKTYAHLVLLGRSQAEGER